MEIQALIFDYNGVLVDDVKIHIEAYYRAAVEMGYPITVETVKKYISYAPAEKRKHYLGDVSIEEWNKYMTVKGKHYFKVVAKKDVVFSAARNTLPALAGKYSLALASNTPREYFERVFPASLAQLFKVTLFADDVKKPKPDPEPLLTIFSRLGLVKEQCRYIGDSIVDVRMAKLVGVPIFAVATGDASYQELLDAKADVVLNNLNDLESQLKASAS